MSEIPNFGDHDPALYEPSAEQLVELETATNYYFENELTLGEKGVSVDLGFGYTVHFGRKEIVRLRNGEPKELSVDEIDELRDVVDYQKEGYDSYTELLDDGRRLYISVSLPDKTSLSIRSQMGTQNGTTGMMHFGSVGNVHETGDLFHQAGGYDGFELTEGQLKRIADLSSIALDAIKQRRTVHESDRAVIDINKVKACVDYLVETSNTYDRPDQDEYVNASPDAIKALHDTVLPHVDSQSSTSHYWDRLYAKYQKGLPVAQASLGYTLTTNPDGSVQRRIGAEIEESKEIESSLNNAVVTLFEKTADGEAFSTSFTTISEEELADKTSPLNWTAMLLGESLESMLEAGSITREEYEAYSVASSLREAAQRRRKAAEENFRAEREAGFHHASSQDVSKVTDIVYDMLALRHPEKDLKLQELLQQVNEQIDEIVEGTIDVAEKTERIEFTDGTSIDLEQKVIVQYRDGQAVELTPLELDKIYASEGRNNRWEERYNNRFFIRFNMPNNVRGYVTGKIGDEEAIGCYYEDGDATGSSLHARVDSKAKSFDKYHEEFLAANEAQVSATTNILSAVNEILSKRHSPTYKFAPSNPELQVEIMRLLETTATKNGNTEHRALATSIEALHAQLMVSMVKAHMRAQFTGYSAHSPQREGMSETSALVSRHVEGNPISGYSTDVWLHASEQLNVPDLLQLNDPKAWSFDLRQSGQTATIKDMEMSPDDLAELLEDLSKLKELEPMEYEEAIRAFRDGEITEEEYRLHTSGANYLNAKWLLRQVGMQNSTERKATSNDLDRALEFIGLIKENPLK
jgi:hypothetical protein